MSIRVEGADRVSRALDNLSDISNISRAIGKGCAAIERAAKQKAPKGTGALRRSITSEVDGTVGRVFTTLEYAPYIEYGTGLFAVNGGRTDVPWNYQDDEGNWHSTSGQKPRPFMVPALNENREEVTRIIKEGIKK